ncbi:hypothetical protein HN587_00615 [Candidatus Woesearchaeota archaeon]|jgi:N-acetylglucosamine malate deacetylase 1|nr:hypothetical protein [Candidatus Woesearchaeota archaeon]
MVVETEKQNSISKVKSDSKKNLRKMSESTRFKNKISSNNKISAKTKPGANKVSSENKSKSKRETILVLCAHPDDEVLGPGGAIAKYKKTGKYTVCIIFSYGEQSHWWMKKKYTVEKRVAESKAAAEIIGYDETMFLGLKDLQLKTEIARPEVIERISNLIMKYDPERIFTHSMDDMLYKDHVAVHTAVLKAIKKIKFKGDIYTFNIWTKDVRNSKNPKLYVDITDTFSIKIKALKCFASQKMALVQLLPTVIFKAVRYGFSNKTRYAEMFVKIK